MNGRNYKFIENIASESQNGRYHLEDLGIGGGYYNNYF
jgi:hypothetical protein